MAKINLDALIPREDFEVNEGDTQSSTSQTIQIRDLEGDSFFYNSVRKPDFQRETSDWDENKIAEFVKSFLNGDLIPSVILWNSGKYVFAIDGAHRLSALISWVNDDYGDGIISKTFYQHDIPQEQVIAAQKTRRKIEKEFSSYKEHVHAVRNAEKADEQVLQRAQRLASLAIQLQWVKGNAEKAEDSFFKINQHAAPINSTELRLLKSRKKPNAIAARAIIRAGSGHKYWSKFEEESKTEIVRNAKIINDLLFTPKLNTPIKTLDIPLAGKSYSPQSLALILDLVDITNNVSSDDTLDEDSSGDSTIKFLKRCKKILNRITGTHASSLGLHPVVYFYSSAGRYQVTAFLAFLELVKSFEKDNLFSKFITVREKFESILIDQKVFIKQVNYKYGSGIKSYRRLKDIYLFLIERLSLERSIPEALDDLTSDKRFEYIEPGEKELGTTRRKDFSTDTKSASFLRDALREPLKCKICNGLIHINSISIDHIERKEDGGLGNIDNAQLTHPFCNSTIKN